jgi:hypothetical protein
MDMYTHTQSLYHGGNLVFITIFGNNLTYVYLRSRTHIQYLCPDSASSERARYIDIAYGGHSLAYIGSRIEAPLIPREVLPETYFLLVIMSAA